MTLRKDFKWIGERKEERMAGTRRLELPTSAISRCRLTVTDCHPRALGDLRRCQELSETVNRPTAPSDRDARVSSARTFSRSHSGPLDGRQLLTSYGSQADFTALIEPCLMPGPSTAAFSTPNSGLSLTRKFSVPRRSVKRFPDCCESQPRA